MMRDAPPGRPAPPPRRPGTGDRRPWVSWAGLVMVATPPLATVWPYWLSEVILSAAHLLAGLALLLAAWLASRGRRGLAVLAIVLAGVNMALVARPVGAGLADTPATPCERPVRAVSLNILSVNHSPVILTHYLEAEAFDVVFLQEYNEWHVWPWMLEHLRHHYPHQVTREGRDVAILSRLPFVASPVDATLTTVFDRLFLASGMIHAVTRLEGREVVLVSAHLSSPYTQGLYKTRNRQLSLLADVLAGLDRPVILGADLNGVRWNPRIDAFLKTAGLGYLDHGFPPPTTRPNWLPVLGVQIDYVAPSADAFTGTQTVGPDVGSDHLPLEATLCPRWADTGE
ncbi:endonuclease/exonuclease/phosphatase family protein [Roseospira visakhapatnamensis]|uniref:Endonuclease/exonuclease/phosphatase (EEP) superfamily protein YafD n=1 Tax=Roseospira visakhapatnamensis TaxID=390880 RepID=A0A7W6RAZ4_9PROT|nr:endonuclease/exonuclease/phosphatase family protein [Roseospira visakhapatnamensis]MBB4264811.1 endonuclease/exonuclease/phosphatase (EEP) superfamily protein YafD [Roseospira visakhapatnamensis]